jgi:spore coat protein JC
MAMGRGLLLMWIYEKRLQFPVNIKETNAQLAQAILSQIGGPDGELGAATRYLSQRYTMPYKECMAALSDIGTEELGHLEIVSTIVYQLTKNLSMDEITASGFDKYYVDHTLGIWPQAASGAPFTTAELQSTGDAITDLYEDMAAEQKARTTYDNLLRICRDYPDVYEPIKFLRAREIVHFQRFGECLRIVTDKLDEKNFYAFNPEFDKSAPCLNTRCE